MPQSHPISFVSHITMIGPVTAILYQYSNICFSEREGRERKKGGGQAERVHAGFFLMLN